jgi:hypothetical protein
MRELVEGTVKRVRGSEDARLLDENFHAAFRMMTSAQARAGLRSLAGAGRRARALRDEPRRPVLLLARRLVENGVRFVTVNTFLTVFNELTWDIHGSKPFISVTQMKEQVAPMYDQAYSALIEDLPARHARRHAGRRPLRVRPHAEGQSRRRPRPLAAVFHHLLRRRRGARAAASSARATPSAVSPPSGPVDPGDIVRHWACHLPATAWDLDQTSM